MTQRTFTFLIALIIITVSPSWSATTWYVNGAGLINNGFLAVGNDSTGNGTKTLPYLTINKAESVATAGDTIYCNTATYNAENTTSNRLVISKAGTIATDPTALAATGKATLQEHGATLTFSVTATTQATFSQFIIDGASSGQQVARLDASANIYCQDDDFINTTGASTRVFSTNGTNVVGVFERCTCTGANGNASTVRFLDNGNAGASYTVKGGKYDSIGAVYQSGSVVSMTLLASSAASDGQRCTVSNCTHGFVLQAGAVTLTTLDIENVDSVNLSNPLVELTSTLLTVSTWNIRYCLFTGDSVNSIYPYCIISSGDIAYNYHSKASSFFVSRMPLITNLAIHNNTINQTSATGDPISLGYGGTGCSIYNNVINSDSTVHMINVGHDGTQLLESNTAAQATFVNLGDTSADTYVAQEFTTISATTLDQSFKIGCFRIQAKSQGSPVGTETITLYSDNANVPNASLEVSEYTLQDTALTTTPTWIEFWFPNHTTTTGTTNYWIVVSHTGTPDASNYVKLSANATGLNAHATSTNGSSWTTGVSGSLLYQVRYGSFELVNPLVYGNTVTCTSTSSAPHGIILGALYGGKVYGNLVLGTGIGYIAKLVDGSGANTCILYDNLWYSASTGPNGLGGIVDKGSRSVLAYHNTCVNRIPSSTESLIFNDYEGTLVPSLNGQPSINCVYRNNTFYVNSPSGSGTAVQLGSLLAAQPTCVNPTITNNAIYATGAFTVFMQDYRSGSKVTYSTYSAMTGAGWNAGGAGTDPLLANETNPTTPAMFRPAYNSPALSIGTNLSGTISPYNDILGVAYIAGSPTAGALNALFRTTTTGHTLTTARLLTGSRTLTSARSVISSH